MHVLVIEAKTGESTKTGIFHDESDNGRVVLEVNGIKPYVVKEFVGFRFTNDCSTSFPGETTCVMTTAFHILPEITVVEPFFSNDEL